MKHSSYSDGSIPPIPVVLKHIMYSVLLDLEECGLKIEEIDDFEAELSDSLGNSEGLTYSCDHCDFTTSTLDILKRHQVYVHDEEKYPWDLCEFPTSYKSRLNSHNKTAGGLIYSCDQCDFESIKSSALLKHKESVHNDSEETINRRLQCDQCEKSFSLPRSLKDHKLRIHEGVTFNCNQCDYKGSRKSLSRHKNKFHEEKFKCDQCDFLGPQAKYLKEHIEVQHMGLRYHCDQCEASFSVTRNLNQHIKEVHQEKTLLCDQCHFTTNHNHALQHHIKAMHLKIFSCAECDVVYKNGRSLQDHMEKIHSISPDTKALSRYNEKKWHMCDKCPFKTKWKTGLSNHMDELHGTNEYSCDECDYKTMLPKEFKKHWGYRHDHSTKRFPCDQCHYSATYLHVLKTHIQGVHEGVKYPCDLCDYKGRKADVIKHKNNIHKKIRIPCDFCTSTFATEDALRLHKKSKHPDEYVKYARTKKSSTP